MQYTAAATNEMAATNDSATMTPIAPPVRALQAGVPSALYEPLRDERQKEDGQGTQVLVELKPSTYEPLCKHAAPEVRKR